MKKLIQSLVIAGVMATTAGAAFADMGEGMMGHGGMQHMDPARLAQIHARHLSELKAKLKITATQEAAWNTFADAMKPPADLTAHRPDRAEMDKLTTPERIDKMRALHKERMAAMEAAMDKRADATKAFYASLSPEQKKIFDAEHALMDMRAERQHRMRGGPDARPAAAPAPKQ